MTFHRRLWGTELVRGIVTLAFGLLFLLARPFASYLVIYSLGSYLIIDGLLELFGLHKRKINAHHRGNTLDVIGGVVSLLIGLLCLLSPHIIFYVLSSILALLLIFNGVSQFRHIGDVHGGSLALRLLSNCLLVLLGLFLLFFPAFVVTFFVLFLGSYMLVAGSSLLLKGYSLYVQSHRRSFSVSEQTHVPPGLDAELPASTRRAIVFVRRAGANGLGHIGWGFEWRNGQFYVGSVENIESKPFANPDEMGFWCMKTSAPLMTMHNRAYSYDEYKLFFVPQAHLLAAWRRLVWESQEPYSFVHHNCCDVVYEILRAYGSQEVLDPASEYVPNDWYDALPGTSYPLMDYPPLPASQIRQSQREMTSGLLAHMKGSSPPARLRLRRPWEELLLILNMMVGHLQTRLIMSVTCIAKRLRRGYSIHNNMR